MKKKSNGGFIKVIALILVIVFGLKFAVNHFPGILQDKYNAGEELAGGLTYDEEAFFDKLNVPSDIKGWTKYDKYNAGLGTEDGSDSDQDGLTDKEEIEQYKTDPLKKSTADDLYTDGYKVSHGMDPLEYCEYEGEVKYEKNKADNIQLLTPTIENLDAQVKPVSTDIYTAGEQKILAAYEVYGYDGDLTIDLTEVLKKNQKKISGIEVQIGNWFGTGFKNAKYKTDGNTITIARDSLSNFAGSVILVMEKKGILETGMTLIKTEGKTVGAAQLIDINSTETEEGDGLAFSAPLLQFFKVKPKVYYLKTDDEELNAKTRESLIEIADLRFDMDVVRHDSGKEDYRLTDENCIGVSEGKLASIRKILDSIPGCTHFTRSTPQTAILNYFNLADFTGINRSAATHNAFGARYEFPFENFGSNISPGGNCAGIAHIVAYGYNNNELPALSGSYMVGKDAADNEITISWDIDTKASANDTLIRTEFANYKSYDFTQVHTKPYKIEDSDKDLENGENGDNEQKEDKYVDIMQDLSDDEQNFVNMIGCYWKEANEHFHVKSYEKDVFYSNYSFELIELMMDYLDTGKILEAAFSCATVTKEEGVRNNDPNPELDEILENNKRPARKYLGHAVNIVGYERDKNNPDIIYFKLYDSNYPSYIRDKYPGSAVLVVKRHSSNFDHADTFDYCYAYRTTPEGWGLYMTNDRSLNTKYEMVIMDDHFNILNDMVE